MAPVYVLFRFVSRPELLARPIRSLLMAGTVAVGVALLTAMHVATESIVGGFASDLERLAGKADLQVTFGTGESGFPEELLAAASSVAGVSQVAALVRGQVSFEDGERESVELFGIDVLQEDVLDLYDVTVREREKDDFTILNDPRGVFVTDVLANERGLDVGSRVRLSGVDGTHDYTVRGIFETRGLAEFLGGKLVAMYLPAAQPVAGRRGDLVASMVDQIDVRLENDARVDDVRRELGARLGDGYRIDTPLQRRMTGEQTVEGLRATLVGMSSLALLASLFIVYASTSTMVVQRLPAMATLAAIGATPRSLVRAIVVEAATLGALGSVVGTALGLALASFVGEDAAAGMGLNYSLAFDASRVAWDPLVVFGWNPAGGILAAACSAYAPARHLHSATLMTLTRSADSRSAEPARSSTILFLIGSSLFAAAVALLSRGVSTHSPDLVSIGGILFMSASVLCMLPVLGAIWRMLAPLLPRLRGIAGQIASENLLRSMQHSLVTASAITLSVAIAVGAGSLVRSFRASVSDWYGFSGDALVASSAVAGGWLAAPVDRSLEPALRNMAGVSKVETLRVLQGQPYEGQRIAVVGLSDGLIDSAFDRGEIIGGISEDDARLRLKRGEAVAVSRNFATRFRWGSTISIPTPNGAIELPVVSRIPDYVSDQGSILVSQRLLAEKWSDSLVNYFAVTLSPGSDATMLAERLDTVLDGKSSMAVTPTEAMIEKVDGLIGQAFADIDTIKMLVLFLTAVGIADLVFSNAIARRRELAVLRLVGLTDAQVVQTALLEALVITLGAAVCGVVVGVLCAWLWVGYNYPVLVGYVLDLRVSWGSILASFVLAVLSAAAAGIAAARYSLSQSALQVIRFE